MRKLIDKDGTPFRVEYSLARTEFEPIDVEVEFNGLILLKQSGSSVCFGPEEARSIVEIFRERGLLEGEA